jgi:hypothetical protein
MVHVGVLDHGSEGVLGVVGDELVSHMFLPELAQIFLGSGEAAA